jgi:hypothetical protein
VAKKHVTIPWLYLRALEPPWQKIKKPAQGRADGNAMK